jgi:hypothetical protein
MWFFRQIGAPFAYLRIKVGSGWCESKLFVDFGAPFFLAVALCLLHREVLGSPEFFGADQFVAKFSKFFELLSAFFLAALAAVAVLDRKGLDEPLRGFQATLERWSNERSQYIDVVISRRQFVCYLFAYLSAATLLATLILPFFEFYVKNLKADWAQISPCWFVFGRFIFFGLLSNIVIVSLYGIYFLSDRIQTFSESKDDMSAAQTHSEEP